MALVGVTECTKKPSATCVSKQSFIRVVTRQKLLRLL
jgi:hypothetical protein